MKDFNLSSDTIEEILNKTDDNFDELKDSTDTNAKKIAGLSTRLDNLVANTGNYNAQVEQYRQETKNYNAQVEEYHIEVTTALTTIGNQTTAFNTVEDMKNAVLSEGQLAFTKGYYQPYDGGHTYYNIVSEKKTEYDIPVKKLFATPIFDKALRPEQFGCYGDGVHDDTENLINTFECAKSLNKNVTSSSNKIYNTTKTLELADLAVNFNNATIRSSADIGITINANATKLSDLKKYGGTIIEKMQLDCKNGINIKARRAIIKDCHIYNVSGYAISLDLGYENTIRDCLINGIGNSAIGIIYNTTDTITDNVTGTNFKTGVVLNKPNNLNKIHLWIADKNLFTGSIFIDSYFDETQFAIIIMNCESDTYETYINTNGYVPALKHIGCTYILNNRFVSDDSTPTLIKYTGNYYSYLRQYTNCFQPVGCIFNLSTPKTKDKYKLVSSVPHSENYAVPIARNGINGSNSNFVDITNYNQATNITNLSGTVLTDFTTKIYVNISGELTNDRYIFVFQNNNTWLNFKAFNYVINLYDTQYGNPTSQVIGEVSGNSEHTRLQLSTVSPITGTKWFHVNLIIPLIN
jgi:hypothetical protein